VPKTTSVWNPAEYATVAERITAFYAAFPFGRIVTELAARTDRQVTFKAAVYRSVEETHPAATGWASEREGDGDVNAVACLENAETSAVGRALANLGFSASRLRPSREEMQRGTERSATHAARHRTVAPVQLVREVPATSGAKAESAVGGAEFDARQRHADAVHDALVAVEAAERAGLPLAQVERYRHVLGARSVPPSEIARIERELRAWMRGRFPEVPPRAGADEAEEPDV
jgi:hypothetical protein